MRELIGDILGALAIGVLTYAALWLPYIFGG